MKEGYEEVVDWLLTANDATPKEGTDAAVLTFYPEKYAPSITTEEVQDPTALMVGVAVTGYTDSFEEASATLDAYSESKIPETVKRYTVSVEAPRPTTWDELAEDQEIWSPWKMERDGSARAS